MCAVQTSPRIDTPRLTLRRPVRADADRIVGLVDDYDIARMTTRIPHPYGGDGPEGFWAAAQSNPGLGLLVIDLVGEGPVGSIGLSDKGGLLPEVGYWLGRPYWGEGLATEAVGALLRWAHAACGQRGLFAGHFADNPASGRVLEKAGFLYTGEVQPRFSLARGETAPTRMMVWLA
ncbi:MAG TPA: GNAT family N-acetyltransferase [Caulobacteraceae bacterium]|jgi:RimJ/RimL family protein N-acetyltransferase|nr:GNAT family N-acetyltransferase [Caulobacteraceae bacterium]